MGRGEPTRRKQLGKRPTRPTSAPLHTTEEIRAKIDAWGDTRHTILSGFFELERIADPAIRQLWAKVLVDRGFEADLQEIERLVGLRDESGAWRGSDWSSAEVLPVTRPKGATRARRAGVVGNSGRHTYTNEEIRAKIEWEGETLYTIQEFFDPSQIADPAVAQLWAKVRAGHGTVADMAQIERLVGLIPAG